MPTCRTGLISLLSRLTSCGAFWLITRAGKYGPRGEEDRQNCRWTKRFFSRPTARTKCWHSMSCLARLEKLDRRQGRIVELRYFGGLTVEEAARVLGVSLTTVRREWTSAKAYLYGELKTGHGNHA